MPNQTKRVVVVDDYNIDRQYLVGLVREAGGEIVGVGADGEEGLWLAQTQRPDLILTDLVIPKMDGNELAVATEIPCILASGDLKPRIVRAFKENFVAIVDKGRP